MPPQSCYEKQNVSLREWKMHQFVYDLNIVNVPKIISYNKTTRVMRTAYLGDCSISSLYGEEPTDVPEDTFDTIREIIKKLYIHGITYPDITGYNFLETTDRTWIIDFEHARYVPTHKAKRYDKFIDKFMDGHNGWNPRFR